MSSSVFRSFAYRSVRGSALTSLVSAALSLGGCSSDPDNGGPTHAGAPLWVELDFDTAIDLGHTPTESSGAAASAISLREVTNETALAASAAGGNQHGVGVAFVDLNGDRYPDIFVANGTGNRSGTQTNSQLWLNDTAGDFVNASDTSGIAAVLDDQDTYSVAAADYDADGDLDLYVTAQPRDFLLQNDGTAIFTDVTSAAGAGGPDSDASLVSDGRGKIAAWGDFDGDGWLDVAVASSTLPSPDAYLLRNERDGTFSDITIDSQILDGGRGNACAVLWTDYDDDGDQDLWIWNDRGGHVLLQNAAQESFIDVTAEADDVDINNPMGIDAADVDHDLDLDYYVAAIGHNPLLINNSDGTFTDAGEEAGTDGPDNQFGWGLGFEDFDADTWPDIFVAQEDNRDHVLFTHDGVVPPTWQHTGVPHIPVASNQDAHNVAVAFADYDRDGRTDIVAAGSSGTPLSLYRNETDLGGNHWLNVRVVDVPDRGGVGGVSARVAIKTGELIQFRELAGGASRASSNELTVRFGLGRWDGVEWLAVQWPDGRTILRTNVAGDQEVTLP